MKQKKKGKTCFVIYIAGERIFVLFIYDVIMKQNFYKRSTNHYSLRLVAFAVTKECASRVRSWPWRQRLILVLAWWCLVVLGGVRCWTRFQRTPSRFRGRKGVFRPVMVARGPWGWGKKGFVFVESCCRCLKIRFERWTARPHSDSRG